MTPGFRDMPVVTATFDELRRGWVVALPGGLESFAALAEDVPAIVARQAPGSSIRYVNASSTRTTNTTASTTTPSAG